MFEILLRHVRKGTCLALFITVFKYVAYSSVCMIFFAINVLNYFDFFLQLLKERGESDILSIFGGHRKAYDIIMNTNIKLPLMISGA